MEKAIEYTRTTEDFDDLVDPHTLPFYCLGPKPFSYVLRDIDVEQKKSKC